MLSLCSFQSYTASSWEGHFGELPPSIQGLFPAFYPGHWRQLTVLLTSCAESHLRVECGVYLQNGSFRPGGTLVTLFSHLCPDSLFPPEEKQQPSPHGDLAKAARNPRGDTEVPVNCSSCPGPPSTSPAKPMVQLLQRLLRTNLSNAQSASPAPPVVQTTSSLLLEPERTALGKPGASQAPAPSSGSPVSPGPPTLPPVMPGTPSSPVTPESSSSTFGAQKAFRWPLSATPLTEAETPSMMEADLSETLTTSLRPQRLSAALTDTPNPVPQQSTTDTSKKEDSTI